VNYITLGPTPGNESCAQVGADDYSERVKKESKAYIAQLVRINGEPPPGARFCVKNFQHDFGTYHEVAIEYDNSLEAIKYALAVDDSTPGEWDEEARKFLELE
jgi:hypothetical protein